MSQRILFLGVYGMEMVECGGALAINANNGGHSFASVMLAKDEMKAQLRRAAEVLGVERIDFNDFERGGIDLRHEYKLALVRVIRETRPDIIITQDPEHSFEDLDPDRRPAMLLILEAIALAGRDYGLEAMPELAPHPVPTIYYMSPKNPNCSVTLAQVWQQKEEAMDCLSSQMTFSGHHFTERLSAAEQTALHPRFAELSMAQRGREVQRAMDRALYLHTGLLSHSRYALAEPYRRQGIMELDALMV
ncbi:LmbE family protein [Ferrimonas balearica DSM 9799]|uniref:LmbE family protein n=1 Tax=Ferrimonas balearica (strain DSM 9799 / CCM 4581 / KCTC 23876 / PAT) TaxID=550540 RepID=E1SP97_FERBD|nr:PIG-L family deacetylase [Ferrimonas balearica]ADN75722.1 LmbE family protein [Ferrimonas balearica DSM 9799]MBY5979391.1 PIG-L family deacetylase [Ferrimonas balearica]